MRQTVMARVEHRSNTPYIQIASTWQARQFHSVSSIFTPIIPANKQCFRSLQEPLALYAKEAGGEAQVRRCCEANRSGCTAWGPNMSVVTAASRTVSTKGCVMSGAHWMAL